MIEANGLFDAILSGDYSIEICGKECVPDSSLSGTFQVVCEVPLMVTEYSKDLHDYPESELSSLDVATGHQLVEVDANPNYLWMKESWQHHLQVDTCEMNLGSGIKADKATLHIANNHWWPYIKFEVQGQTTNGWEVKQSVLQIAGGVATHDIDLG